MIPYIKPQVRAAHSPLSDAVSSIPWKPIFQRLPGVVLLAVFPFTLLGPVWLPWVYSFYFIMLHAFFVANNLRTAYGVYVAYTQSVIFSTTDWLHK